MTIDTHRLQKQSGIIGTSKKINELLGMIGQVAPVDISVLVSGESGVGKEVMARAIHRHSKRFRIEMKFARFQRLLFFFFTAMVNAH